MEELGQYIIPNRPETAINPAAMLESSELAYVAPTDQDVRAVIKCCFTPDGKPYTGKAASLLVGVDARTIRKWCSPHEIDTSRKIPYSAWRLLLIAAGLVPAPNAKHPASVADQTTSGSALTCEGRAATQPGTAYPRIEEH